MSVCCPALRSLDCAYSMYVICIIFSLLLICRQNNTIINACEGKLSVMCVMHSYYFIALMYD